MLLSFREREQYGFRIQLRFNTAGSFLDRHFGFPTKRGRVKPHSLRAVAGERAFERAWDTRLPTRFLYRRRVLLPAFPVKIGGEHEARFIQKHWVRIAIECVVHSELTRHVIPAIFRSGLDITRKPALPGEEPCWTR